MAKKLKNNWSEIFGQKIKDWRISKILKLFKEFWKFYPKKIKNLELLKEFQKFCPIFDQNFITNCKFSEILSNFVDFQTNPTGAEPSPAYFNILMHGDEPEVLDGTQLAADWTFSGLQKFGQGLMDRLRGQKLPSKLLERVSN